MSHNPAIYQSAAPMKMSADLLLHTASNICPIVPIIIIRMVVVFPQILLFLFLGKVQTSLVMTQTDQVLMDSQRQHVNGAQQRTLWNTVEYCD